MSISANLSVRIYPCFRVFSVTQRSYQERVRGEARKKWLQQIVMSGETSAAQMEPIYKTVFQSLYKVYSVALVPLLCNTV